MAVSNNKKGKSNLFSDGVESADAIIIGAGVGGLTAAAYIARAGRKVIVIEQDNHVGGTAHVFRRGGFTFPTGPQSVTMPAYIADSLCELGIERGLSFIRDHFQVHRGSLDIIISQPLDRLAEQLLDHFPNEQKGIHIVIKVLEEVIAALNVLQPYDLIEQAPGCISDPNACAVLERWGSVPARDLFDRHLKDQSLKDLLGSQGTGETEMPIVLLAQMWRFMSRVGIWHVKGGIEAIPVLLAERVRSFGGEIRLGERVKYIKAQDGAVTGVELAGGKIINAPLVISDADYRETIIQLLQPDTFPENESEEVARMALTSSEFTVFLGVKRELVDLSAFRGDHLFVKLKEGKPVPWELKKTRPEDFLQDEIWLSWWSRHDSTLAPPGCEALILKVGAPFEVFAPFNGGGRGRHQDRYYSLKEELADALVAAAANILPGLSGSVVVREVATPLTYKYWGHRSEGSVAGWSWRSGEQSKPWARSLAVTKVSGLLMVGLHSFTRLFYGGMGTSMYSGKYAADIVLKKIKDQ
jgi:phytoene dehydrogenase-like protein